jgi:site-specific DNA-methyltransferase (adenine-specific)
MRSLPDNSVHAVVTDPPYGLEFMGKDWDGADGFRRSLNDADAGRESVFGRTSRTSPEYRTESKAAAGMAKGGISAADGRPSFLGGLNPKCLTCEKWQRGSNPCTCESPAFTNERLPRLHAFQEWCEVWSAECLRVLRPGGFILAFGGSRTWHRLASAVEDAGFEIRDSIAWLYGSGFPKNPNVLKPAFEPIVVGRKPMIGTVAVNVEKHGTGALNIEANRIEASGRPLIVSKSEASAGVFGDGLNGSAHAGKTDVGRWPTNVVLDESQAAELDRQTGVLKSGANPRRRGGDVSRSTFGEFGGQAVAVPARGADEGGASRFFPTFRYEAKAGTDERPNVDGVLHPTVKPLDLMRWLVRLATPEGGTILEPFAGSGTTLEAALLEGFNVIGIEREATYLPLIEARITKPLQVTMF